MLRKSSSCTVTVLFIYFKPQKFIAIFLVFIKVSKYYQIILTKENLVGLILISLIKEHLISALFSITDMLFPLSPDDPWSLLLFLLPYHHPLYYVKAALFFKHYIAQKLNSVNVKHFTT